MPPEARARLAWVAAGAALVLAAWAFQAAAGPWINLAIPAGAWMIMRGLT